VCIKAQQPSETRQHSHSSFFPSLCHVIFVDNPELPAFALQLCFPLCIRYLLHLGIWTTLNSASRRHSFELATWLTALLMTQQTRYPQRRLPVHGSHAQALNRETLLGLFLVNSSGCVSVSPCRVVSSRLTSVYCTSHREK
jgi:hypothetical protein